MKKYLPLLIILSFVFSSPHASAQVLYAHVNTGYALGAARQNLDNFGFMNSTIGNNSMTLEQVKISLGQGVNFTAAGGIMFNEQVGLEFALSYLLGHQHKATMNNLGQNTQMQFSSQMIRINPSLLVAMGKEKIDPYAKFGFILGVGTVMFELEEQTYGDISTARFQMNGGMSAGLTSALGANLKLSENTALFGEMQLISMSYAPARGELIESTINGISDLSDYTTNEKEVNYVEKYTRNMNTPELDSLPTEELKQYLPFSSLGFNFGIRFNLTK